jgi:SWI/SNF-related matrix-associated actin-dependent regulator of chromatin subfamily D
MPNAGPPQPTPQQLQQQAQLDAQRREAARARSKVPTDKEIPDGVEDDIIGDAVERYRNLRQAEKNLDAVMMRKRLENQDALPRTHQLHKTMRIWISNTTENQPWQQMTMDNEAFDFGDSSQATYKVKIEGRLLDDGDEPETNGKEDGDSAAPENGQDGEDADKKQKGPKPAGTQRTRLSHFFKQITVDFDRNASLQPDQLAQVEWKKTEVRDQRGNKQLNLAEDENFDCIEFERKGDENLNVTINLVRDDYPERYRLSSPLADLLDMVESDRGGVITGLWHYIRHNKLYEDEETRQIRCDAKLRPVRVTLFPKIQLTPTNLKAPHRSSTPTASTSITFRTT